jgi:hypothetical protein
VLHSFEDGNDDEMDVIPSSHDVVVDATKEGGFDSNNENEVDGINNDNDVVDDEEADDDDDDDDDDEAYSLTTDCFRSV